jgi:hypothetical protein
MSLAGGSCHVMRMPLALVLCPRRWPTIPGAGFGFLCVGFLTVGVELGVELTGGGELVDDPPPPPREGGGGSANAEPCGSQDTPMPAANDSTASSTTLRIHFLDMMPLSVPRADSPNLPA